MDVVAVTAGPAQTTGRQGVQDDGVADPDVGDGLADRLDPAGVLVTDRVGERHPGLLLPLALDDVQVGPAHAGATDPHDDVEGPRDPRVGHVHQLGLGVVGVKLDGLHRWVPSLVVALLTALREMAVWQVVGRRVWYIDHVLEVGAVLQPRGERTAPAPPTPGRR